MVKTEVPRLFDLLEQLYQGKKKPRDNVTISIWAQVLKPWTYEQVRAAAVRRARTNRYFPDPSELAELLPKSEEQQETLLDRNAPPSLSAQKSMEMLRAWQVRWHQRLAEMGLPTLREAVAAGMTPGQWARALEEAGAWKEDAAWER